MLIICVFFLDTKDIRKHADRYLLQSFIAFFLPVPAL